MLIEFTFENFKSYKKQATLRMEASSLEEHKNTLQLGSAEKECLPVAAIYGPNGGGKSGVLQAFASLKDFIVRPFVAINNDNPQVATSRFKYRPFIFDAESQNNPTTFFVLFQVNGYIYRYILSLKDEKIIEEYLHRKKPGRGAPFILFERINDDVKLGPSLNRKGVDLRINPKISLLTFLEINYDFESISDAFNWFLSCHYLDYSRTSLERTVPIPKDSKYDELVIEMMNHLDIDIKGIRYVKSDEGEVEAIYLSHASDFDKELEYPEESNGTQKLLSMALHIILTIEQGSLLLSDELDAKLHPKILRYIINLFTDASINQHGAQLIFTSHDMVTLDSSVLRRDEIWFAAKDADGSSQLYCLADICDKKGNRIRPQNAYSRQYLSGKYGADPYLSSMLSWDKND